jgi:hypothetical protein
MLPSLRAHMLTCHQDRTFPARHLDGMREKAAQKGSRFSAHQQRTSARSDLPKHRGRFYPVLVCNHLRIFKPLLCGRSFGNIGGGSLRKKLRNDVLDPI